MSSPFPIAPLRTGLAPFSASGSPVNQQCSESPQTPLAVDFQNDIGITHHTYLYIWQSGLPTPLRHVDGFPALGLLLEFRSHEALAF